MDKKLKNLIVAGLIIVAVLLVLNWATSTSENTESSTSSEQMQQTATAVSGNATYVIEGQLVSLTDGKSEVEIPNSSAKTVTQLTPFVAYGDLNKDLLNDAANILVQSPGGSGAFYYAAVVMNRGNNVAQGTNALLIGDRIEPTSVTIVDGVYQVNYLDRPADAAMSDAPSVEKTKMYVFIDDELQEVEVISG